MRQQAPLTVINGDTGLVAGGFDSEDLQVDRTLKWRQALQFYTPAGRIPALSGVTMGLPAR